MKVLKFYEKSGEMKVEPENFEDLWHLMKIINPGDIVIGKTIRRFRSEGEKGESGEKKEVVIELKVERTELHKNANILRVMGIIISGSPEEYIQKGSHHTIDFEIGYNYTIKKEKWNTYELDRIKEAEKSSKRPIVRIIVMDDKIANVATLRSYGIEFDFELESRTSKRDEAYEEKMKKYFAELAKIVQQSKRVIIAGPGFTAETFRNYIKDKYPDLLKNIYLEHVSTAEKSGVYELIRGGIIKQIIKEDRITNEFEKIEKLMIELGRNSGLAVKGEEEVKEANQYSALAELYILDEYARKNPQILDDAKEKGVEITVFTSGEDPWKRLQKFGGIAGILRFKYK
ncbi:MAG: mRNA surveillance protein pelota [Candidatus Micrarchaeota archaeon]|nr:mRNA surveillance protein pelota [Candidatus Micrarchaeota archaeon]